MTVSPLPEFQGLIESMEDHRWNVEELLKAFAELNARRMGDFELGVNDRNAWARYQAWVRKEKPREAL